MNLLKKIHGKVLYWRRGVSIFTCKSTSNFEPFKLVGSFEYCEFTEIDALVKFPLETAVLKDYQQRFSKNEIYCTLILNNQIVSYGWINPNPTHLLGELDLEIKHSGKLDVLYNFETNENYRGKSLYPYLLQQIVKRNSKTKMIYALAKNTASVRGIKKAGFQFLGNIYGINKNKINKMLWRD